MVLVPVAAIVRDGEETAVLVAADGKAHRRVVTLGLSDGVHVEIVDGVAAGDQVIVDGQAGLPDGPPITAREGEPMNAAAWPRGTSRAIRPADGGAVAAAGAIAASRCRAASTRRWSSRASSSSRTPARCRRSR